MNSDALNHHIFPCLDIRQSPAPVAASPDACCPKCHAGITSLELQTLPGLRIIRCIMCGFRIERTVKTKALPRRATESSPARANPKRKNTVCEDCGKEPALPRSRYGEACNKRRTLETRARHKARKNGESVPDMRKNKNKSVRGI